MIVAKQILVATDFSPESDAALAYGRALARSLGATLHVLHAVANPFLRPTFADPGVIETHAAQSLATCLTAEDRTTLNARAVLEIASRPADAIIDYARRAEIDLIVVGTHGRTGFDRALMGSVAEHLVRSAPCPVLTVRHPERELAVPDEKPAATAVS
ncbi:MAG: universal stress protein [Acidobacteria bacterium]|nr:universal stress protein [Acidobacteriota bacterium]